MKRKCINCNATFRGNFCSNCGQESASKINSHFLWHDIQHALFHLNKQFFFTIKELFIRPGHSIREFIEGKRDKYFKPTSLVIILAGIYGVLSHYYKINVLNNFEIAGQGERYNTAKQIMDNVTDWVQTHYSILALIQLPIFALGTYLGFKNIGYNFVEHMVMNLFLTAQRLALHLVAFPIIYICYKTQGSEIGSDGIDIFGYILFAWSLFKFFNSIRKGQRFWRIMLSLFICWSITMLLLVVVALYFEYCII